MSKHELLDETLLMYLQAFVKFYQNIPLHLDPVAFYVGSFPVHWYSLSYIVALTIIIALIWFRIKRDSKHWIFEYISRAKAIDMFLDIFIILTLGMVIGGRLGYVLLYDFSYFLQNPFAIVSPIVNGQWQGLYGMSFHGGTIGILLAGILVSRNKKIPLLTLADFIIPTISLGYFFGRLGNFLGGELFGKQTGSILGMYFPADPSNLRHPSQIYEALGEGLLIFLVLWPLRNSKKLRNNFLSFYLILYGIIRFLLEFFRQPDAQLGLYFNWLSMGQILSAVMMIVGLAILFPPLKKEG